MSLFNNLYGAFAAGIPIWIQLELLFPCETCIKPTWVSFDVHYTAIRAVFSALYIN